MFWIILFKSNCDYHLDVRRTNSHRTFHLDWAMVWFACQLIPSHLHRMIRVIAQDDNKSVALFFLLVLSTYQGTS
jgi:hypothetical protein